MKQIIFGSMLFITLLTFTACGGGVDSVVTGSAGTGTDFTQILLSDSFEGGTLGAQLSGSAYSGQGATGTTYSNAITPASGTQCIADIVANAGDTGDAGNVPGWYVTYPGSIRLSKGDELWLRVKFFMPADYDYTANARLKFLRVRGESAPGVNAGYNDIYLTPNGNWVYTKEGGAGPSPNRVLHDATATMATDFTPVPSAPIKGQWNTVELYVRFDNVAAASGGSALVRFWHNGVLVGQVSDNSYGLLSAGEQSPYLMLMTYWNGGAPKAQTIYWDDLAVAVKHAASSRDDSVHLGTDVNGYKFIGVGSP